MNLTAKTATRAMALALGLAFTMSMMTEPAAAWWRGGCWGCGAFAAGAIAGAAVARPVYAAPVYYGAPAPVYPVCPIGVSPWYCN